MFNIPFRLPARGNGEKECVIRVDDLPSARRKLDRYVNTIVAEYPFISAFGALVSAPKESDVLKLDCVTAICKTGTIKTHLDKVRAHHGIDRVHSFGLSGKGVGVAVIDTGVAPHIDLISQVNRIAEFVDFVSDGVSPYDDNGHGTAVSGILCGNGFLSSSKYKGVAYNSSLVALKAIGAGGEGSALNILKAMQWIYDHHLQYNIRVVCMSFGAKRSENDPLVMGAEALWKEGLTVVASCGNDGNAFGTVSSPGVSPKIITVGAAQNNKGLISVPEFSSRGIEGEYIKPDILADGVEITSASIDGYSEFSGTSMSAPIVAGMAALILERYPYFTPDKIKEIFIRNAAPLPLSQYIAGNGYITLDMLSRNYLEDSV